MPFGHSTCKRCSSNLVVHLGAREMRCHHCGHRSRIPTTCPQCGAADLAPIGHGTQRIEETLVALFPNAQKSVAAERYGISATDVHGTLRSVIEGTVATQVRVGDRLLGGLKAGEQAKRIDRLMDAELTTRHHARAACPCRLQQRRAD